MIKHLRLALVSVTLLSLFIPSLVAAEVGHAITVYPEAQKAPRIMEQDLGSRCKPLELLGGGPTPGYSLQFINHEGTVTHYYFFNTSSRGAVTRTHEGATNYNPLEVLRGFGSINPITRVESAIQVYQGWKASFDTEQGSQAFLEITTPAIRITDDQTGSPKAEVGGLKYEYRGNTAVYPNILQFTPGIECNNNPGGDWNPGNWLGGGGGRLSEFPIEPSSGYTAMLDYLRAPAGAPSGNSPVSNAPAGNSPAAGAAHPLNQTNVNPNWLANCSKMDGTKNCTPADTNDPDFDAALNGRCGSPKGVGDAIRWAFCSMLDFFVQVLRGFVK